MRTKIFVLGLVCSFVLSCTTSGPKKVYFTDTGTGDIIVPVEYVGGLEMLAKKTKGNLYVTNSLTKFVSETGKIHLEMPTKSISGVYVGDEVKRKFGKTLARWLLIGPFALFFKDKSEVLAVEFTDKEKNLIVHPIFKVKVGTGPMLKRTLQLKAGLIE